MNNEPVAWMSAVNGETVYVGYEPAEGWLAIPLYTHPADTIPYKDLHQVVKNVLAHPIKKLTDEEIIEIGLLTTDSRFSHIESPLLLEFARAILRKASEK